MSPDDARKFVQGLANYDAMAPLHRAEFDKALAALEQAIALDFVDRLDDALNENSSSSLYEPTQQVGEFMDKICEEHRIVFVPHEGFRPAPKENG